MVHLLHPSKFYAAEPHKLNASIAKEMHEEIKHYQNGLTEERGTEYRKIRTRNNSVFGHLSGSV